MEEVLKYLNRLNYFVIRRMAKKRGHNFYLRNQSLPIDVIERNFSDKVINRKKILIRRVIYLFMTIIIISALVLYGLYKFGYIDISNIVIDFRNFF